MSVEICPADHGMVACHVVHDRECSPAAGHTFKELGLTAEGESLEQREGYAKSAAHSRQDNLLPERRAQKNPLHERGRCFICAEWIELDDLVAFVPLTG